MDQIPLEEALMCVNCNTIVRMPRQYCPHCAGEHLVAIGIWLNPRPRLHSGDAASFICHDRKLADLESSNSYKVPT
jgi:hypothetical protein